MKKLIIVFLFLLLVLPLVTAEDYNDTKKQQILHECYEAAYWQANIDNSLGVLPKKACGWIAYRVWELGTERGIDVDSIWVCQNDRYRSHIISGVVLSNGTFYAYQPNKYPWDYYSKNYFGKQELIDTWNFEVVSKTTGASWPTNMEMKEGLFRIYIKAIDMGD